MKTIGEKILALRENLNMKQKELADLVGITEATLSRYENDKRQPRGEIVPKLAKALNVTADYLLDNEISIDDYNSLNNKEIIDIEKEAETMISKIDSLENLEFCGTIADDEDKEYLKAAYQKFLMDVRVYNKQKYTPKKYKK
ncbi:MAG: helix-turn-helix domain-containing protein [Clostridium sp.]|uniref:helix-turn-helix domain-containing protein n=1 Tax=Clostridium sp. DSM 8431 TaxID=1761781 RepID=UPI0008EF7EBE|nr:helix-turn-helix transcriptional regulator [Clostridium sp. DSM 8431]MCR4944659.1 helix-turn-helix domain-containing protein [Clostridium sp.]SFU45124.1 Transcriptional regulator, contains XRE-family HTH domain [Clostridium sp. DSM 8431]